MCELTFRAAVLLESSHYCHQVPHNITYPLRAAVSQQPARDCRTGPIHPKQQIQPASADIEISEQSIKATDIISVNWWLDGRTSRWITWLSDWQLLIDIRNTFSGVQSALPTISSSKLGFPWQAHSAKRTAARQFSVSLKNWFHRSHWFDIFFCKIVFFNCFLLSQQEARRRQGDAHQSDERRRVSIIIHRDRRPRRNTTRISVSNTLETISSQHTLLAKHHNEVLPGTPLQW